MQKYEQVLIEDMQEKLNTVQECYNNMCFDYDSLRAEVILFLQNVDDGQDVNEALENFRDSLAMYCDIDM